MNSLRICGSEKQYFCLIRSFSRHLSNLADHENVVSYCYRCLHRLSRQYLLNKHSEFYFRHVVQTTKMPSENDNILKFYGIHLQHPVAYTIYADFKSLLIPISSDVPTSKTSYIEKTTYYFSRGYAAYVVVGPAKWCLKKPKVYTGKEFVDYFLKRMKLSPMQERAFQEAEFCSNCKRKLDEKRTGEHCHLSDA